jgi:tetratricopeptide (TPR) repeat protein
MKKKARAKVKASRPKIKKTKAHKTNGRSRGAAVVAAPPKPAFMSNPNFAQAVQNYQAGLKAMQERKFERAKALLAKVVAGPVRELADRAAVHLNTCNQQLARSSTSFKTPEEHYDYAVSLINAGEYDEARAHLEKLLKQNSKADYALYGLALLSCALGSIEEALAHLDKAIKLNPQNRLQARNDSDFQRLVDDPRFTELLYPEPGEVAPVAPPAPAGKRR